MNPATRAAMLRIITRLEASARQHRDEARTAQPGTSLAKNAAAYALLEVAIALQEEVNASYETPAIQRATISTGDSR